MFQAKECPGQQKTQTLKQVKNIFFASPYRTNREQLVHLLALN